MECFEQTKDKEKLSAELSNLSIGSIIAVGGTKLKIATYETNFTSDDMTKLKILQRNSKISFSIDGISYSKNYGIQIWIKVI